MAVLPGDQSIAPERPPSGEGQDQQLGHFVRFQRRRQATHQIEQRSQLLHLLVERPVELAGLRV